MKSRSLHNRTKKGFMIFFTVTLQPFMKYHSPPCFPSLNITKNAETHPPYMCDVIIEQLLKRKSEYRRHDYLDSAQPSFRFKLLQFLKMNNTLHFDIKIDLSNIPDYLIHGNENKIIRIGDSKSTGCDDNLVVDALQKQPPNSN